ncbi:hypothetical protein QA601_05035 [Chitinispirillales bacterium ANBcel5]|uniref:hypothetical protein n=1 Tax=Cellulosispirillum alkaliphilum TaxID=3039283 RepID=UPI002A58FE1C|nr:hypothetical protein [Chitinispirillales bacterium ANBcel5]
MNYLYTIFFFDISALSFMLVLSYLSKRLGEALKIRPYYKILYITSAIVLSATSIELISLHDKILPFQNYITMGMRLGGAAIAFFVCLVYWKWLFGEFKK